MNPKRPDFARRVRALMAQRHIGVSELAVALGISEATVAHWLNGQLPNVENLTKLANFLDVLPTDLLLDLARYGFDANGCLSLKAVEPPRDLLKYSTVCHLLSIGAATLENWMRKKVFIPVDIRAPGARRASWRISRADYEAYIQKRLRARKMPASASRRASATSTRPPGKNQNAMASCANAKASQK